MGLLWNQIKVLLKKDLWVLKSHKKSLVAEILLPILIAGIAGLMLFLGQLGQEPNMQYMNQMANNDSRTRGVSFIYPEKYNASTPHGAFELGRYFYNFRGHSNYEYGYRNWESTNKSAHQYKWENVYEYLGMSVYNTSEQALENYDEFHRLDAAESQGMQQPSSWVISTPNVSIPMEGTTRVGYQSLKTDSLIAALPCLENLYYQKSPNMTNTTNETPEKLYDMYNSNFDYPKRFNSFQMFATMNAMLLQFAFIPLLVTTGGRLVDEKRTKMREHLRVMGVRSLAYLLSVYGFGIARITIIAICMFIAFVAAQSGLNYSYVLQAMMLQWVFGLSLVSFATLMPCFFSKSMFSAATSMLFVLVFNIGGIMLTDPHVPEIVQWLMAAFFSPSASIMATAQVIGGYSTTLAVPVWCCVVFMLLQTIWYALVSQYLYALFPGEYGVSQHWLFPIYQVGRWIKGDKKREYARQQQQQAGDTSNNATEAPAKLAAGEERPESPTSAGSPRQPQAYSIVLKNLFKFYGSQRDTAAVNGLSLSVKKGEIFALLGHNGAGKTTTISMLTGMLEATKYDAALIDDLDLEKDVDLIRHHIGTCPQFDILFEDLSASQHMEIFAALKGVSSTRGTDLLTRLSLPLDGQKSVTFSGGMKRRLSVACAMVGGSPIVFLDEPSSGLDPMSRRELWDMIREERALGKTIILTTHFMEEADYLGERIAIMSHGRLYCCDTSTALKQRYGVGYYLTVVKSALSSKTSPVPANTSSREESDKTFDAEGLLTLCQKHCPGTTMPHDSLGDASFLLPTEHLANFGSLLTMLEARLTQYGVSSYGIRMNSLEDVFVNISEKESDSDDPLNMAGFDTNALTSGHSVEELFAASTTSSSVGRFCSQVFTIFRKKALFLARSKRMLFLGIVVPVITVVMAWATAIPMGGPNGGNNYYYDYSSGTKLPPYEKWVVPYIGNPTPAQQSIMARASQLAYEKYEKFPGASETNRVHLSFKTWTNFEAKIGAYVDAETIAFTSAAFDTTVPLLLGNADQWSCPYDTNRGEWKYGHSTNKSNWVFGFGKQYNPIVGLETFKCFRQAWLEAEMGTTDTGIKDLPIEYFPQAKADTQGITPAPTHCYSGSWCNETKEESAYLLIPTGVFAPLAVGLYASSACLQVADELNRHVFHTIRMHGMSALAYWVGTALFDTLVALFIVGCMVAGPFVRQVSTLATQEFAIFSGIVMLGDIIFTLLFSYAYMCFLPSLKPNSHIALILGMTMLALLLPTILSIIWLKNGDPIPDIINVMFPPKAVMSAFVVVPNPQNPTNPFDGNHSVATAAIVSVFSWCLVPILLLWVASTSALRSKKGGRGAAPSDSSPLLPAGGSALGGAVDADVQQEVRRVDGNPEDDMVEGVHLRKVYPGGKVAVEGLTFGVRKGECFGLLGPNGAGKTTAVKMLLKEHSTSHGFVHYPYTNIDPASKSLDGDYQEARLGVCQQHDTLWETFTAEEHLDLYLRIRLGTRYKKADWEKYIRAAISKVYLEAGHKRSHQYSGGMKRKLAVAIALYTGAKTVFLDEPSTGMDPYARRAMWKSINEALANDRGVILTTHSMEEADAVCARIAIVTKGLMQCIGSSQHLKNKFGTGYAITLLLKAVGTEEQSEDEAVESKCLEVDDKMKGLFGSHCRRGEVQGTTVSYNMPKLNIAEAFTQLAQSAEEMGLESYSVNQVTSLEQIFIGFAESAQADAVLGSPVLEGH